MGHHDDAESLAGTWTGAEVARRLGVAESTIWKWVERGKLSPVRPGAKPLRFPRLAVVRLESSRRPPAQRRADADLWDEVDAEQATRPGAVTGPI